MPFRAVGTAADWLAALRGFAEGADPDIPVLGAVDRERSALADRLHDFSAPRLPRAHGGQRIVATLAGSQVSWLGADLARALGALHVELDAPDRIGAALPTAPQGEVHVCLVALTGDLAERDVVTLHDALWRTSGSGTRTCAHLGVLTAPTLEQLSWMIAKTLAWDWRIAAQAESLSVLAAASASTVDHAQALIKSESTYDTAGTRLLTEHIGTLTLLAHGRDDVIQMHDTVICANDGGRLEAVTEPNLPACAYTGTCFRTDVTLERVVPAKRVLADFVFTNSCMGLRLTDGLFPERYLLAHGFQAGAAAAYLASATLVSGREKLNLLVERALSAGLSFGQVASLVDDHLRFEASDHPYFTLIGVPWLRLRGDIRPAETTPYRFLDATAIGTERAAPSARAHVLRGSAAEGGAPVFFVSQRSRAAAAAVAGGPPERIAPDDSFDLAAQVSGTTITRLADLPLLGLRTSRLSNVMVALRDQVTSLARAHQEVLEGNRPGQAVRRMNTLDRAVSAAQQHVADTLFERGTTSAFEFEDLWSETLTQTAGSADGRKCPYCTSNTGTLESVHPVFPHIRRRSYVCERCTITEDFDARSQLASVTLDCVPYWPRGTAQDVRVEIACAADLPLEVEAVVGIHLKNGVRFGASGAQPERVTLKPGGTVSHATTIEVDPEPKSLHQHFLKAFVVVMGTVSFASRPIWFRP